MDWITEYLTFVYDKMHKQDKNKNLKNCSDIVINWYIFYKLLKNTCQG